MQVVRAVVDASVVVKWIFPDAENEADVQAAVALLRAIQSGSVQVVQPAHWLAEVATVISRLAPQAVHEEVGLLYAMEFPVLDTLDVYEQACKLAVQFKHHLFDTLYHAVAMCALDTTLVTTDERYYRKAHLAGCIARLGDFRIPA